MSQTNVKSDLDASLVNPLIKATMTVMEKMTNTQVQMKQIFAQEEYLPSGDLSGVIGILGEQGEGTVALSFPLPLANIVVARFLGTKPEHLSSEDRCDGIGELVNMVSGQAKAALSNESGCLYKLTLPTVIQGAGHQVTSQAKGAPFLVLEFESEGHIFHLQLSFKRY